MADPFAPAAGAAIIATMDDQSLTLRAARQRYFDEWGFGDGGYEATWVALKPVAGINVGFPNTDARRRAVKMHDLHHVLTGYAADWTGEAEIGAWEIGAGCGAHVAAWILNLLALGYGVFIAPRQMLAAMARGRRSRSLYAAHELDERLLDERVGTVRQQLGIPAAVTPTAADAVALAAWWVAGASLTLAPLVGLATFVRALF